METKNCQNCKNDFTIEPEDFDFYAKIDVPPPTFCPECRMIRRMCWRNNRSLHRRSCGLCDKTLISMYKDDGVPVFCIECFYGDNWDQFQHAQEIDWSLDFYSQLFNLFKKQPRIYQYRIGNVVNSDYGNSVVNCKNAYLSFSVIDCEDIMYSEGIDRSKNTLDSFASYDLDNCSYNMLSNKNFNSHYMVSSQSCIDSFFLYDCVNCQNCCLSSNLRNQRYVFNNKKLSKEEYDQAVNNLNLNLYSGWENAKTLFNEVYRGALHKYADIIASQNVTGNFILNSKDVFNSFDVTNNSENISNSFRMIKSKDAFDCQYVLSGEFIYECSSASQNSYNQVASLLCFSSKNMEYSMFCKNCSDCFGCIGLKNVKYCILNKQYSKEEYLELVPRLREFMSRMPFVDSQQRVYKYGDFFPFSFSPFGYNETVALDYFKISGQEAKDKGYNWKSEEIKSYNITLGSHDLPDSILEVSDSILSEIIACPNNGDQMTQCATAYKITPEELQFYRQKKLPLPRFCPNCRHYERLQYRNPMKLYSRQCTCDVPNHDHEGRCEVEFETSYAPDRPEKVYCEKCYQKEVL